MRLKTYSAEKDPRIQGAFKDMMNTISDAMVKHFGSDYKGVELLALLSYAVGSTLALQDQRMGSREEYLALIMGNIELGNKHVIESYFASTKGNG